MILLPEQLEDLESFQNEDQETHWKDHDPEFEWTQEDYDEFERQRMIEENERLSLAAWWEMEGVRCWTFGPPRNPYL